MLTAINLCVDFCHILSRFCNDPFLPHLLPLFLGFVMMLNCQLLFSLLLLLRGSNSYLTGSSPNSNEHHLLCSVLCSEPPPEEILQETFYGLFIWTEFCSTMFLKFSVEDLDFHHSTIHCKGLLGLSESLGLDSCDTLLLNNIKLSEEVGITITDHSFFHPLQSFNKFAIVLFAMSWKPCAECEQFSPAKVFGTKKSTFFSILYMWFFSF
jgi:hypothetical protein